MKRTIIILILLVVVTTLIAQQATQQRIYLRTDRWQWLTLGPGLEVIGSELNTVPRQPVLDRRDEVVTAPAKVTPSASEPVLLFRNSLLQGPTEYDYNSATAEIEWAYPLRVGDDVTVFMWGTQ
jgi:hypothetical protein